MRVTQIQLSHPATGTAGEVRMVTFLPTDPRIKRGVKLTLDDNTDIVWEVIGVYDTVESNDIKRKWGLALPKSQRTEV